MLIKETNDFDEINNFFIQNYWNNNRDLREAHLKSLNEMEELKRFQGSTFDTIARRKVVEDRDTILELTGKWTIPRYQSTTVIPTSSNSCRNAKPFYRNAEPQRRAAKHLGYTWFIGKRFCKSNGVFSSTLSARVELRHENSVCGIVLCAEKFRGESFTPSDQTRRQHEQILLRRKICLRQIWTMGHGRSN